MLIFERAGVQHSIKHLALIEPQARTPLVCLGFFVFLVGSALNFQVLG